MGLFSFITAPLTGMVKAVTGVISAGKTKATAKIYAEDARKQRVHDLRMANIASGQQASKAKQTQIILIVVVVIAVVGFLFLRKRR